MFFENLEVVMAVFEEAPPYTHDGSNEHYPLYGSGEQIPNNQSQHD